MPDTPAKRPRLNWFSPLRPARTDIAHYALRTLPALANHFDLVVWTERPYWPLEIEAYATVRQWDGTSWAALNAADVTLYHIGNNAQFHSWIWDVARRHSGVVVLHDTRLHEFFAAQLIESPSAYLDAVRRCHGAAAALHAAGLIDGRTSADALAASIPLTEMALQNARGAIVHTGLAFRDAAAMARCSVLQLDLPYEPGVPPARREWNGTLQLVVFGYLAANRRLEALLEAIATFPQRQRLRLDILGELADPESIARRIEELSLKEIVRTHGFVAEDQLDQMLDRSHLAVNLRFPTMGEASGSQLRIWSRGLASLVTRTGWYAELPPDTVGFVDPANEIGDLREHFRRALERPDTLRAMGDAGRARLEAHHHPERYARELAAGLEPMMRTSAPVLNEAGAAVARVLASSGMDESAKVALARRAAEELSRWTA
jgi:glycosyltransferase involved in cell wall biosynthesis